MKLTPYIFLSLPLFLSYSRLAGKVDDVRSTANRQELIEIADGLNQSSQDLIEIETDSALLFAWSSLSLSETIAYSEGRFHAYNNLGMSHDKMGNTDSTFHYFQLAYREALAMEDDVWLSIAKNNLGMYYLFQKNLPLALKLLLDAVELDEARIYNKDPMLSYSNIGLIYEEWGDLEQAQFYYAKAATAAFNQGTERATAFGNLCLAYNAYLNSKYKRALQFYQLALHFYQKSNDLPGIAETTYYLGLIRDQQREFPRALEHYHEALRLYTQLGTMSDITSMYKILADTYRKMGMTDIAIEHYKKAEKLAVQYDVMNELVRIYYALAEIYRNDLKDYANSDRYQLEYSHLTDSIYQNQVMEDIQQLETNYDLRIKAAESDKLLAERARDRIELERRTSIVIIVSLLCILMGMVLFIVYQAYRRKHSASQKLEKIVQSRTEALVQANRQLVSNNEELERFAHITSHDLKEPLRNISSFTHLIQRKIAGSSIGREIEEYMGFVLRGTRQMHELVEDIASLAKISDVLSKKLEKVDIDHIMREIIFSLQLLTEERKASIVSGEMPVIHAHNANIFLIFKNLIENGIKYNASEQPVVKIDYRPVEEHHLFTIEDNGIGIAPEYHQKIFEMFRRLNDRKKYSGSGMGLAICKKIVQNYQGRIWVESEPQRGSRFCFTIPRDPFGSEATADQANMRRKPPSNARPQ